MRSELIAWKVIKKIPIVDRIYSISSCKIEFCKKMVHKLFFFFFFARKEATTRRCIKSHYLEGTLRREMN